MEYYAHTREDGERQTVKAHLIGVSKLAEDFSVDELKYMVNPLLERLKHENEDDVLAFLPSEIELMKDILTFTWPNVSGESFGKKVLHAGVMTKLVDCTNEANLKASREKAKLIRSYDDTDNS